MVYTHTVFYSVVKGIADAGATYLITVKPGSGTILESDIGKNKVIQLKSFTERGE